MSDQMYFYTGATLFGGSATSVTVNINYFLPPYYACRALFPGAPGYSGATAGTAGGAALLDTNLTPPYLVDNLTALRNYFTVSIDAMGVWTLTATKDMSLTVTGAASASIGDDKTTGGAAYGSLNLGVGYLLSASTGFYENGGMANPTVSIPTTTITVAQGASFILTSGVTFDSSRTAFAFIYSGDFHGNWQFVIGAPSLLTPGYVTVTAPAQGEWVATISGDLTHPANLANTYDWYFCTTPNGTYTKITGFGSAFYYTQTGYAYCIAYNMISTGQTSTTVTSNVVYNSYSPPVTTTTPTNCLPAGTRILMADGSYLPVEMLEVGMKPHSYDEGTRQPIAAEITRKYTAEDQDLYEIETEFGTLVCTGAHRIYSKSRNRWVAVSNMEAGDSTLWMENEESHD